MSKIKMKKEIRTKWLKSLRSGKYKQTTGELLNNNQYCCLGVLGRNLGIRKEKLENITDPINFDPEDFRYTCKFPSAIVKVNKRNESAKSTKSCDALIDLNDNKRENFESIADY